MYTPHTHSFVLTYYPQGAIRELLLLHASAHKIISSLLSCGTKHFVSQHPASKARGLC